MKGSSKSNEDSGVIEASQSILQSPRAKTMVAQTDDELFEDEETVLNSPNSSAPITASVDNDDSTVLSTTAVATTAVATTAVATTAVATTVVATTAATSSSAASTSNAPTTSTATASGPRLATSESNADVTREDGLQSEEMDYAQTNENSSANVIKEILKCQHEINATMKDLEKLRNVSISFMLLFIQKMQIFAPSFSRRCLQESNWTWKMKNSTKFQQCLPPLLT